MAVIVRTRRKYRGLVRSNIQLLKDALARIYRYDIKHPTTQVLDPDQLAAALLVTNACNNALDATVPV